QPHHLLVEARVVLHRAGAERIEPHVDGVVLLAEPRVVAHHLRLGGAGEPDRAPGGWGGREGRVGVIRPEADRSSDLQAGIAADCAPGRITLHHRISLSAPTSASMSPS